MGNANEPRKAVEVPVRVFGTDCDGKPFSENVTTVDVSQHGVKVRGLRAKLQLEEVIGVTYSNNKARFKVKWLGDPGTPTDGVIGLLNLSPDKPFWDFPLPQGGADPLLAPRINERRRWPRVKCSVSAEVHVSGQSVSGQSVIWAKASDLSQGGCFIEMAVPLPIDSRFDIALWLGETKLRLQGQVASLAPGFGNGVRFLGLSASNREHLRRFIEPLLPTEPAPRVSSLKRPGS
jgi:hypothetical protein